MKGGFAAVRPSLVEGWRLTLIFFLSFAFLVFSVQGFSVQGRMEEILF